MHPASGPHEETGTWPSRVGVIGLGIMGGAIARNLAQSGQPVVGFDLDPARLEAAQSTGVDAAASAGDVAATVDVVLTSLPSAHALAATAEAIGRARLRPGLLVVELSTLSLDDKAAARARLAAAGLILLDCPVSGTGAQAARRDLVVYASGDSAACERCRPLFARFGRKTYYLGEFGNGTKAKFVANLLVAIHNVAAAEAVVLGLRAGLDPATLCEVVGAGAGGSRMLEVRGPMMVSGVYEPGSVTISGFQKDLALIDEFADRLGVATPLFSMTPPLYAAAAARGGPQQDTAAVCAVLQDMADVTQRGR